jgi:FtsZ-binding cell division protein ZapB
VNGREKVAVLNEEICKEHLEWARRRLEALDKIEVKLKTTRSLAVYAATHKLSEREIIKIQGWINILQTEVNELDESTARMTNNSFILN